ncbi:hypothetical protein [Tautonia rosea]|uniref:hypothetical protein n=1 Tax=Tautonia rosea TaxID=2728037 RepID=UPI00147425FE|nr:hypothetical protein [Tautonia rosea]
MSETDAPVGDPLEQGIGHLLRTVPETWAEFDPDSLSESEEQALMLLTAAGMIGRRVTFRLQMFGHSEAVEATISLTGEYGLVEAMDSLSSGMWDVWRDIFERRKAGDQKDEPAFHCERVGKEQWRLTDQGVLARSDLDEGEESRVFDFVLRRGFFNGQPRLMPDGRLSQRLPVAGKGKLERMRRVKPETDTAGVSITNWDAGAHAFASAFEAFLKAKAPEVSANPAPDPIPPGTDPTPEAAPQGARKPRTRHRPRNQGKADQCVGVYLGYLERNECPPGPTEIAAEVGCSVATASRAIQRWEEKRKAMARDEARGRYRDQA